MFDLHGKIALVTGSSRGIGRSIALELAKAGASIIIHGRKESDELTETKNMLEETGTKTYTLTADTSKPEEIIEMFQKIKYEIGKLDILVNNAAVLSRNPFLKLTLDEWDTIMDTNARGYFVCSQQAAKIMINEGCGGKIINISSISQFEAAAGRTHYCASKGAIGMLTKCMALELAPYKINVNAVLPGSIHTDFNNDVLSDTTFYKKCVEGIPIGRLGKPQDVAGAVVMLASDEASYISGAELVIDGAKTVF